MNKLIRALARLEVLNSFKSWQISGQYKLVCLVWCCDVKTSDCFS